jgi:hypothetical protein
MNSADLTCGAPPSHKAAMRSLGMTGARILVLVSGTIMLGGCVTVNAPSEPIVIELNINITQEVIYRLATDVQQNIEENPEIF